MYSVSSVGNSSPTLVTGGTGFLGRHLVARLLAAGRPVTVLARRADPALVARGVRFITASLDDAPAVAAACATELVPKASRITSRASSTAGAATA